MFERIAAAKARLWTWEVVTGFDGVLDPATLRKRFAEDFPKVAETCRNGEGTACPVFREMVCFNSSDGRRHRYLVMLADESMDVYHKKIDRVLPQNALLYGCADKLMRSEGMSESCGNCRMAFLAEGNLHILVFFEGRLCHWSEEPRHNMDSAQERLERFDVFLERDDLFSRVKKWEKRLICIDEAEERERLEWWRCALKDSFWRFLDLDDFSGMKPRQKWRIGLALLVVAGLTVLVTLVSETSPSLKERPEFVSGETRGSFEMSAHKTPTLPAHEDPLPPAIEKRPQQDVPKNKTVCSLPSFKLYGVIEGRVFSALFEGGLRQMFALGDSIGNFAVHSIGKDCVRLTCGNEFREVYNGQ